MLFLVREALYSERVERKKPQCGYHRTGAIAGLHQRGQQQKYYCCWQTETDFTGAKPTGTARQLYFDGHGIGRLVDKARGTVDWSLDHFNSRASHLHSLHVKVLEVKAM